MENKERELRPNELIQPSGEEREMLGELVERDCLPDQSFSVVPVETAVDRIDKEIAGWTQIVVRANMRIESLERLRAEEVGEEQEHEESPMSSTPVDCTSKNKWLEIHEERQRKIREREEE